MITAIDTNILLDIFLGDAVYGPSSEKVLQQCLKEGKVCACSIVWTEVAAVFPTQKECVQAMSAMDIEFSSITQATALKASDYWRHYRKNGGARSRISADFLIGAHSVLQADRLLTRDKGFFRDYFKSLEVLVPKN